VPSYVSVSRSEAVTRKLLPEGLTQVPYLHFKIELAIREQDWRRLLTLAKTHELHELARVAAMKIEVEEALARQMEIWSLEDT
jgi:hypothetical protein